MHSSGDTEMEHNVTTDAPESLNTMPTLPEPNVVEACDDGLIPARFYFEDLHVELMDPWRFLPGPGDSDFVTFIWDVHGSVPFELPPIELKGPIVADNFPYSVWIPQAYLLNSAVVDLSYRVNNLDPNSPDFETSDVTTITIDRDAPGGSEVLQPGIFPVDPITEDYLSARLTVDVEIPGDYFDRKSGDTVLCYLSAVDSLPTRPPVYEQSFTADNGPMFVNIPVAEFRKFPGSLRIYLFYRLRDRAGNTSFQYSLVAEAELLLIDPPSNLPQPEVPAYDADFLIDREDARRIVSVRIRQYDNWMPGDRCFVQWHNSLLTPVTVSTFPFSVPVTWDVLIAEGAALLRIIDLPVRYFIRRATDTVGPGMPSPVKRVTSDFTVAGQDHDQAPALLNRHLALVNIFGAASNIPNNLDNRDRDQPVRASFSLFDNPRAGELALLFWPTRALPVATYRVKVGDSSGDIVDFDNLIDWQVIQDGGSNARTIVHYQTDNTVNLQLSPEREVFVSIDDPLVYVRPSFPQALQHPRGYLTCATEPPVWEGIEVLIDPAPHTFNPGDEVILSWQGYRHYPDCDPIIETAETFTHRWTDTDITHTFLVLPYDPLIKPLKEYSGGAATYRVFRNGIPLGRSVTRYVQIDRKYPGSGDYCGPDGPGPED